MKNLIKYIIPVSIIFFNVLIILFPSKIIISAKDGLLLWFNNVIPSLLPFIIGANILSMTGFINLIGITFEPLMQKLFGISGRCSFALIMGFISGYPMGAKITASLYENNKISLSDAQKLVMFTNNSGPLFILGTVAVSMLNSPSIGVLIITAHYLSAITIGLSLRNYKKQIFIKKTKTLTLNDTISKIKENSKNPLPIGTILSKSIKDSMETIVMIGGFIILFSVISKMLEITNFPALIAYVLNPVLNIFDISTDFIFPITTGILEITNGCKNLSNFTLDINIVAIITGIISWGGFSIHAQAIGFLSKTKIKLSLYFLSKLVQSILSIIYVYILNLFFKIDFTKIDNTAKVFNQDSTSVLEKFANSSFNFLLVVLTTIFFAISMYIVISIKNKK